MNTTKTQSNEIVMDQYGRHEYKQTVITAGGRKDNLGKIVKITIIHDCAIVKRLGRKDKFYSTTTAARLHQ